MFMLVCATSTVTNKILADRQISSFPTRARRTVYYNNVIMGAMASQITGLTIVYSTVYSGADQRKQSSASLAFVLVAGEYPAQMASNAENVSIWWHHHGKWMFHQFPIKNKFPFLFDLWQIIGLVRPPNPGVYPCTQKNSVNKDRTSLSKHVQQFVINI